MKQIFDVSMPIELGMPVYKNKEEKKPAFEVTADYTTGSFRETRLHLDAHTGTHVDAPLHMIENGETIETIAIERLVRPCRVVDATKVKGAIHEADVKAAEPKEGEFLLFKTSNSFDKEFNYEFVFIAEDAAKYLAEHKIAGVGVDGLGVERGQASHGTHKALFGAGAVIIEGLRLAEVDAGEYFMIAAPIRLIGLDAAPARVLLTRE